MRLITRIVALILSCTCSLEARSQTSAELEFFETTIRPILATQCFQCHGKDTQENGLRLDSLQAMVRGGDAGPAIMPGRPDESLLFQAVAHFGELQMPPKKKLSSQEVASIRHWVDIGAPWPKDVSTPDTRKDSWQNHWAFQSVIQPAIPAVISESWCLNPIDRFVLNELELRSLQPSQEADRRSLIRRVTLDTTGLLPSLDEIEQFANDPAPDAYERLVDRLLASPAYGQHFARQWLDVARYSDTKGYVYAREERFFVHASAYRDWVIQALNDDMPYDRFLQLQIAADQDASNDPASLIAMGFLTLGRRFLGVTHDIVDDRIDVVTRGTMGLTASCARCHDHKFDPIPTADYYSLYGVFQNSMERQVDIPSSAGRDADSDFEKELLKRVAKLKEKTLSSRVEAAQRVRQRFADYLFSQSELSRYPEEGFDQVLEKTDIIPAMVRRWESYLASLDRESDPIFGPWFLYASIPSERFADESQKIHGEIVASRKFNASIVDALRTPPTSLREVADRYGALFQSVDADTNASAKSELRQVLYGPNSPCEIPDEEIVTTETYFDSATCTELWKLQGEVDRWRLQNRQQASVAVALFDRDRMVEPRVFKRGNPATKGPTVSRHFLSRFASLSSSAFQHGSGRRELADAIVHPDNPLTARVWINRIWQHHFSEGLVRTPSDFGLRAEQPSHPLLLDWLASQLLKRSWSTKSIHRLILTSAAYRQSISGPPDASVLERAIQVDPENRMLWRMSPRRLRLEEIRDALLTISGDLDLSSTSKATEMFGAKDDNHRRTIFGLVDRQFLAGTLRIFDFANPDLHIAKRSETSVPQQALFFMNHPFVASRSKSLVRHLGLPADRFDRQRWIIDLYGAILQRVPSALEIEQAIRFLEDTDGDEEHRPTKESMAWKYGYGEVDESVGKLKDFKELPHFTGTAWQGGPAFPDTALGWVQLTAAGGHPGNDQKHACVRRWVAPDPMEIRIRSVAAHEPDVGDGVRFRILSSRHGLLKSVNLKASKEVMDVEPIRVERGDTIDFVVDILEGLNSDQHLWAPEIGSADLLWNASRDFVGPTQPKLNSFEQLAQILMLTNELIFVD